MDVLELPSMASLPLDLALPSPWDSDRAMAEAVFGPFSGDADGLVEAQNLSASSATGPQDTGFYGGGNGYMTGSSWSVQAVRSSDTSSETSTVLLETSGWAPTTNHSGSCVQSSDSGRESMPAPLDVPGAAAAGAGRTRRCRARRSQHVECGEEAEVAHRHRRPRHDSAAQVQTLEPTPPAPPPKAAWQAPHKGPTLSGVVRPFERSKGTGLLTGRTLEQINMALKGYQAV